MDLSWKDKMTFYLNELRKKLPFYNQPKKQLVVFFGAAVGVIIIVAFISPLVAVSSLHSHATISSSPTSPIISSAPQKGSNGQYSPPAQSLTPGVVINSNTATASLPKGSKTGLSQDVLKSSLSDITVNKKSSGSSGAVSGNNSSSQTSGGAVIGSTDLSNITIYLPGNTGTPPTQYLTPASPPSNITWLIYYNGRDNYSIDYPSDWQAVSTLYNNHEGIILYPPSNPTHNVNQGTRQRIVDELHKVIASIDVQTNDNMSDDVLITLP